MSHSSHTVRVERIERPTADVAVLVLVHPDGADLEAWAPGAHIDLHLPSGLTRQYSLCGDPDDRRHYRLGILREANGRGGSIEVHEQLQPGALVQISAPRNHFALADAPAYLFVAGGIGITPLLTMAQAAQRSGKPWQLVYGGRSLSTMAFVDEIVQLAGASDAAERVRVLPQDVHGLLDLASIVDQAGPGVAIYSCGPGAMLTALEQACEQAGKRERLHLERFSAPAAAPDSGVDAAAQPKPFQVELAKTGITLDVAADQSLKTVLLAAGVSVPFSCEEGYCGSCETTVLDGEPEHHDCVLTPEEKAEGKLLMVCVGRCRSARLVLDL